MPFGKLQPGGGGTLKWSFKPGNLEKVFLRFKQVECPSCKKTTIKRTQVDYQIYWATEESHLNMFGQCQADAYRDYSKVSRVYDELPLHSFKMSVEQDY